MQALIQLGPEVTCDADVVRALLTRFNISENNPPTESQLVELATTLARLASEGSILPDVGAIVRALGSFVSQFKALLAIFWHEAHSCVEQHSELGSGHQGV